MIWAGIAAWVVLAVAAVVLIVAENPTLVERRKRNAVARENRRQRVGHDDRDFKCYLWWGDRGGYDTRAVRCPICNPEEDE